MFPGEEWGALDLLSSQKNLLWMSMWQGENGRVFWGGAGIPELGKPRFEPRLHANPTNDRSLGKVFEPSKLPLPHQQNGVIMVTPSKVAGWGGTVR